MAQKNAVGCQCKGMILNHYMVNLARRSYFWGMSTETIKLHLALSKTLFIVIVEFQVSDKLAIIAYFQNFWDDETYSIWKQVDEQNP